MYTACYVLIGLNTQSSQYTQGLYTAVICQYTFVKQFVPDWKGAVI